MPDCDVWGSEAIRATFDAFSHRQSSRHTAEQAGYCAALGGVVGRRQVTVTFAPPHGKASKVRVTPPALANGPAGHCISELFGRVEAPRFGGRPQTVTVPVELEPWTEE